MLTGLRRNEVAQLRWKDVNLNGGMQVTYRAKGGEIITREIASKVAKDYWQVVSSTLDGEHNKLHSAMVITLENC